MTHVPSPTRLWRLAHHLRDANHSLTDHITLLRDSYRAEASRAPLRALAMVVLPQSLHAVWELPGTDDASARWAALTRTLGRHANADLEWHTPWVAPVDVADRDWAVADIHAQPVLWNLATRPEEWPYSSAHRRSVAA